MVVRIADLGTCLGQASADFTLAFAVVALVSAVVALVSAVVALASAVVALAFVVVCRVVGLVACVLGEPWAGEGLLALLATRNPHFVDPFLSRCPSLLFDFY